MAELIKARVTTAGAATAETGAVFTEALVTSGMIPRLAAFDDPLEAVEPITLQEAKDHLRVVFDDEDDYITGLVVAARQMAEGRLNRTITRRVREQAFSAWGSMPLLKPPFVQIESVSYFDADGVEQFLESDGIVVTTRSEPARVALRGTQPRLAPQEEAVIVRYTAGYADGEVPRPIVQWMLLAIGTMYENRETMTAGVVATSIPEDFVKWLLQPYVVYE